MAERTRYYLSSDDVVVEPLDGPDLEDLPGPGVPGGPLPTDPPAAMTPAEAETFYEDDEDPVRLFAAFDAAEHGRTAPPAEFKLGLRLGAVAPPADVILGSALVGVYDVKSNEPQPTGATVKTKRSKRV